MTIENALTARDGGRQSASGSDYLNAIGISPGLTLSGLEAEKVSPVPAWAGFLLWLGWWMRSNVRQDRRYFAVVVTPTRHTTALIAAFGVQLAGAKITTGVLDWTSLTTLPPGTEVFIQERKDRNKSGGKQVHGVIEGLTRVPGLENQEFVLIRQKDVIRQVSVSHLHEYTITLQSVGGKAKTAIHRHSELFETLIPGFDRKWFITPSNESVIIGETAVLQREAEGVYLGHSGIRHRFNLGKILGIDSPRGQAHAKTALITARSLTDQPAIASVCILDGAAAFRSLEHCMEVTQAGAYVAFLDRTEFDEQFKQRSLAWLEASSPDLLTGCQAVPQMLPAGVECIVCGIPLQE